MKVKMRDKLTGVIVDRLLFLAKLASNGAYFCYCQSDCNDSTAEVQFRYLLISLLTECYYLITVYCCTY